MCKNRVNYVKFGKMSEEKMCRACLSESEELTPLQARLPGANETLEETINFVVNINILLEDGLPDKICKTCCTNLDIARSFKQRFLESEALLSQDYNEKCSNESRNLIGQNCQQDREISPEDTTGLSTGPSSSDSLQEDIAKAENIYDYPYYKIKIEIDENCIVQESASSGQKYLDIEGQMSELKEQSLIKQEVSVETDLGADEIYNESSQKADNVLEHSHIETNFGNTHIQEQTQCIANTTVKINGDILNCNICKYTTNTKKNLNRHIKRHSTRKTYSCNHCSYTTTNSKHFLSHIKTHTQTMFACNQCVKEFKRKHHLKEHLKTHTDVKPYSCDVCGKEFKRKQTLEIHSRIHTGYKPYSCNLCEKKYSNKTGFDRHVNSHADEKPFKCSVCDKKFSHKSYLDSHQTTHSEERPYTCDICKGQFKRKGILENHIRLHLGHT